MTSRRVRRVVISGTDITKLFTGELTVVSGLPDDSEYVRSYEDPTRMEYNFIFESEQFPVFEEGSEIPEANISIVSRRVNKASHWICNECHETYENGDIKLK